MESKISDNFGRIQFKTFQGMTLTILVKKKLIAKFEPETHGKAKNM